MFYFLIFLFYFNISANFLSKITPGIGVAYKFLKKPICTVNVFGGLKMNYHRGSYPYGIIGVKVWIFKGEILPKKKRSLDSDQ